MTFEEQQGDVTFEELLERVRKMPAPTERERQTQAFSFSYGNLRIGHPVSRIAFARLARGWTEQEFDEWADILEWDLP